jgi:hypothetical protein
MKEPDQKTEGVVDETTDPREPYEAPRLECEELFEVLALACGKVVPRQANCRTLRRLS